MSDPTRDGSRLAHDLGHWPLLEPAADHLERLATQIEAKALADGGVSGTEDVLAPPLAATPEELQNSPGPASYRTVSGGMISGPSLSGPSSKDTKMTDGPPSDRNRRSLKDLAKLASSPSLASLPTKTAPPSISSLPDSSVGKDSGIVDLKAMSQSDPQAAERAQTTPLAASGLFEDDPGPPDPPPLSSRDEPTAPIQRRAASAPPSAPASAPAARPSAVAAVAAPAPSGKGRGGLIAGVVGVVAVAAAALLVVRSRPSTPAPVAAATASPAPASPAPKAADPVSTSAPSPVAAAQGSAAPADPEPQAVAKNDTRAPATGGGGRKSYVGASKASTPLGGTGGSTVSGLSAMMAEAAKPNEPPPPPAAPGALGAAVKEAVGSTGAAPAEHAPAAPAAPQFAAGSVPEKPSQGAVTSALGAVLPHARDCLNPDDPVSRANVTFASAGTVTRVVVTGSAAGKPAEECIRRALMKASLPPFAQDAYAATVTVRPN